MIQAQYRKDYQGEFVVLETRFSAGKKIQKREWVENPIENHHLSGRAAVIGSREYVNRFDHSILEHHRGGLLGKKRLQTYGSGDLWKDMKFDFFVTTEREQLSAIKEQNYDEENIVYSSSRLCIENPGRFYLIPYMPHLDNKAVAIYLAAFDGHTEVFLIGYDQSTPSDNRHWDAHVNQVFQAYRSTKFYLVGIETNMFPAWRKNSNVECMDYRSFISYCDV